MPGARPNASYRIVMVALLGSRAAESVGVFPAHAASSAIQHAAPNPRLMVDPLWDLLCSRCRSRRTTASEAWHDSASMVAATKTLALVGGTIYLTPADEPIRDGAVLVHDG